MSRYQCWNCLIHHNGDYEHCNSCVSKGYVKPTMWRPGPNYVPPSNADRIRAMSDEELAKLLCATEWRTGEEQKCIEWLHQKEQED